MADITISANDGSATFNVTTTTLVNDGEWHFVVGTYDGSATPTDIEFRSN